MGKITGFIEGASKTLRFPAPVVALGVGLAAFGNDPAFACRGMRLWSTGTDLKKLKPGEIVVKAKLLEAYKSEERFDGSIMGNPYGMIYYVGIAEVLGGAADTDVKPVTASRIFIRLAPSICEQYFPLNFTKNSERVLVLKKGDTGLYDLVGGQE
jgi:hypothetical protein